MESITDVTKSVYAPIVLFVYNRPILTQQTLLALSECMLAEESDLFIFCDGPKGAANSSSVAAVETLVRSVTGFRSLNVITRPRNLGLANSIIQGVTQVCSLYGKVIVLEDDIIVSRFFLQYMNDALNLYADDEDVASIHGYWYPIEEQLPETFFLRGASCWGWATWWRAWREFESDGTKLLGELQLRKIGYSFDLDGAKAYTKMLKHQISGRNDSWAIRWHASTFLNNRLQLSPNVSLVKNIGFDGSGVHSGVSNDFTVRVGEAPIAVRRLPLAQNDEARAALIRYYRRTHKSLFHRVMNRFRRLTARNFI